MKTLLLIKRAALGDVLRTTAILPALRSKYGSSQLSIEWLTDWAAKTLLESNSLIDKIHTDPSTLGLGYDWVINLEEDVSSAQLAVVLARDQENIMGCCWNGDRIAPAVGAERWFSMSILGGEDRDRLKKANTQTHPAILCEIARLSGTTAQECRPQLFLSEAEVRQAVALRSRDVPTGSCLLGAATWAGPVWSRKTFPPSKLITVLSHLSGRPNLKVWLFGEERDKNECEWVASASQAVYHGPTDIRQFAARIGQCDLLLCADSLALHVANALRVPKIVLVGPTSCSELELYGEGMIITSRMPCLCCYKRTCDLAPDCMDSLSEVVLAETISSSLFPSKSQSDSDSNVPTFISADALMKEMQ